MIRELVKTVMDIWADNETVKKVCKVILMILCISPVVGIFAFAISISQNTKETFRFQPILVQVHAADWFIPVGCNFFVPNAKMCDIISLRCSPFNDEPPLAK